MDEYYYPYVCATHLRFIPCRSNSKHCSFTSDPRIVGVVRRYQQEGLELWDAYAEIVDIYQSDD